MLGLGFQCLIYTNTGIDHVYVPYTCIQYRSSILGISKQNQTWLNRRSLQYILHIFLQAQEISPRNFLFIAYM